VAKSPTHYTRGDIEVWDFIRDQQLNYHLGNAVKYICRAGYKDSKVDDLKKAIHYLENELLHTHESFSSSRELSICVQPDAWTSTPNYTEEFDR
jgi:hypothetical protein